ncbi:hypothetical protein ACXN5S_12470 [Pseudoroseicyclus sp. H15]
MLPKLSNNSELPDLPAWQARSFWAMLLSVVVVLCTLVGFDVLGWLGEIGAGGTEEAVLETGDRVVAAWQLVAPLVLGFWAWIERRAPNYRLVWPWSKKRGESAGDGEQAATVADNPAHVARRWMALLVVAFLFGALFLVTAWAWIVGRIAALIDLLRAKPRRAVADI